MATYPMDYRRILEIVALLLFCCFGVVLYAELQSIHQVYPITDARISNASDSQTRQDLIAERDRRNPRERTEKIKVEILLGIDVLLILCVAVSVYRGSGPWFTSKGKSA
jgi:hypothetical protein